MQNKVELSYKLNLDASQFRADILRVQQLVPQNFSAKIILDIASAQKQIQELKKLATNIITASAIAPPQLRLTPEVDDRQLTALNAHLNLKLAHFKQVQSYFTANPLKITYKAENASLIKSINQGNIRLDGFQASRDISGGIKLANKEFLEEFKKTKIQANRGGLLGNVVTGYQENLGRSLFKGVGGEDSVKNLAKPPIDSEISEAKAYIKSVRDQAMKVFRRGGGASVYESINADIESKKKSIMSSSIGDEKNDLLARLEAEQRKVKIMLQAITPPNIDGLQKINLPIKLRESELAAKVPTAQASPILVAKVPTAQVSPTLAAKIPTAQIRPTLTSLPFPELPPIQKLAESLNSPKFTSEGLRKLGRQLGLTTKDIKDESGKILNKAPLAAKIEVTFSPQQIQEAVTKLHNEIVSTKFKDVEIELRPVIDAKAADDVLLYLKERYDTIKKLLTEIEALPQGLQVESVAESENEINTVLAGIERIKKEQRIPGNISSALGGRTTALTGLLGTTDQIKKNWDVTTLAILKNLKTISTVSKAEGYKTQKNISEGSEGITTKIRNFWDITRGHVIEQIRKISRTSSESTIGASVIPPIITEQGAAKTTGLLRRIRNSITDFINQPIAGLGKALRLIGTGLNLNLLQSAFSSIQNIMAQSFTAITSGVTKASLAMDGLKNQLAFAGGGKNAANSSIDFIRNLSNEYAINFDDALKSYAAFQSAAQGSGVDSQQVFRGVAIEIAAMNLNADEAKSVFLAVQQIMAKGVVSAEELRQQMGEKLATTLIKSQSAMGLSASAFTKLQESGRLLSVDFLPKIGAEFERTSKAAAKMNASGAVGTFNALTNATNATKLALGDLLKPVLADGAKVITQALNSLTKIIDLAANSGTLLQATSQALGGAFLFLTYQFIASGQALTILGTVFSFFSVKVTAALAALNLSTGGTLIAIAAITAAAYALQPVGNTLINTINGTTQALIDQADAVVELDSRYEELKRNLVKGLDVAPSEVQKIIKELESMAAKGGLVPEDGRRTTRKFDMKSRFFFTDTFSYPQNEAAAKIQINQLKKLEENNKKLRATLNESSKIVALNKAQLTELEVERSKIQLPLEQQFSDRLINEAEYQKQSLSNDRQFIEDKLRINQIIKQTSDDQVNSKLFGQLPVNAQTEAVKQQKESNLAVVQLRLELEKNQQSLNGLAVAEHQKIREKIVSATDKSIAQINRSEKSGQAFADNLLANGTIDQITAEQLKIDATKRRISEEIKAEQSKYDKLKQTRILGIEAPDKERLLQIEGAGNRIADLQIELANTRQNEPDLLAGVEKQHQRAIEAITSTELRAQIEVQKLINNGTILKQSAEQAKLQITKNRLQQELSDEERNLAKLNLLSPKSFEKREAVEQRIRESKKNTLDITLKLLENERQAEESLQQIILENLKKRGDAEAKAFDVQAQNLDILSQSISKLKELGDARSAVQKAFNDLQQSRIGGQIEDLQNELKVVETVNEQKNIKNQIYDLERKLSQEKIASLIQEQNLALANLAIEQKLAELTAFRTLLDAKKEALNAQRALNEAVANKDTAAIDLAKQDIELSKQKIALVQTELGLQDELFEQKRQALGFTQTQAQEELARSETKRLTDANPSLEKSSEASKEYNLLLKRYNSDTTEVLKGSDPNAPKNNSLGDTGTSIDFEKKRKNVLSATKGDIENMLINPNLPTINNQVPKTQSSQTAISKLQSIQESLSKMLGVLPIKLNQNNTFTNIVQNDNEANLLRKMRGEQLNIMVDVLEKATGRNMSEYVF